MPPTRVLAAGCLLVLVVRPSLAVAQSDSRLTPPAIVADSFFRAIHAGRWSDAARHVDLDAISAMRDRQIEFGRRPRRKLTAEFYLQHDSTMPRAVAEYQARQFNQAPRVDLLAREFAHVPTLDSLARLSPADLAARWLEARDARWLVRLSFLEGHSCVPADSLDAVVAAFSPPPAQIIGTVIEDSIAYVLHRPAADDSAARTTPARAASRRVRRTLSVDPIPPSITTLRRAGATWLVIPGYEAGAMSAFVSCGSGSPRR